MCPGSVSSDYRAEFHDWQFGFFPVTRGLSRRTRHSLDGRSTARHVWSSATWPGRNTACYHLMCEFTLRVCVLGFGKCFDGSPTKWNISVSDAVSPFISVRCWLLPHRTSKMKQILLWLHLIFSFSICFSHTDACIQVDKCVSLSMVTNTDVACLSVSWHRDLSEWNMRQTSKRHFETTGPRFKLMPEIVAEMRGSKHTLRAAVCSSSTQWITVLARPKYFSVPKT